MLKKRPTPSQDPEALLPLAPATFDILLALVDGERHGYAIMKKVADRSNGTAVLGAGTLYGALKRLLAAGIIEENEKLDAEASDERRRYYQLTKFGITVARAEARRLSGVVREAQRLRLVGRLA